MSQRWTSLTFLHWAYDPADIAPHLPEGTEPDTLDGVTYVGLVLFAMRRVQILGAPPVPYLSDFLETNVRVYAIDRHGRRSVVFLSLDCDRLLPVAVARMTYRLPYIWSSMRLRHQGDEVVYSARRRVSGARSLVRVRVGDPIAAQPMDDFVTARWGLHSRWYGMTAYVPIAHRRWPLRAAELLELNDGLVPAAGLPAPQGAPRVVYSNGVEVHLGIPGRAETAGRPAR